MKNLLLFSFSIILLTASVNISDNVEIKNANIEYEGVKMAILNYVADSIVLVRQGIGDVIIKAEVPEEYANILDK